MTYRQVYENALGLICEAGDSTDTSDYEDRVGYILATFLGQCIPADRQYRMAHQMSVSSLGVLAQVDLDADFGLSDVFVTPAEYYVAAMLVIDENEELSDRFFELYTDALSLLLSTLPCSTESISDRYGALM